MKATRFHHGFHDITFILHDITLILHDITLILHITLLEKQGDISEIST